MQLAAPAWSTLLTMAARTDLYASSLILLFRSACATRRSCWCCRLVAAQWVLLPFLWLNVPLWSPTSAALLPYVLTTPWSHKPLATSAALLLKLQLLLGPPMWQLLVRMPLVAQPAAMVRLRLALLLVAFVVAHLLPSLLVV